MGMTIHYTLRSKLRSEAQVHSLIDQLRQRAFDLPFHVVGPLVALNSQTRETEAMKPDDPRRRLLMQGATYLEHTWPGYGTCEYRVAPTRLVAFSTCPGEGCEHARFGLCRYPSTLTVPDPRQPQRLQTFRTKLSGWQWGSFCKTEYASHPRHGGLEHFLRCHLSVIRVLDAAMELDLLDEVDDESGYWQKRSLHDLARLVGDISTLAAGWVGRIKDACGEEFMESFTAGGNYERLEADTPVPHPTMKGDPA